MKIGFTERGDGGLDLSWLDKAKHGACDAVVVVTKNLNLRAQAAIYECWNSVCPVIVHAGCTGWGGTVVEPNVPQAPIQLKHVQDMLTAKFPADHIVLRIDPIFPTPKGIQRFKLVVKTAVDMGILPACRCRISVLDEYRHVKDRFRQMGFEPIYGQNFYASDGMMADVAAAVNELHQAYGIVFETCAEHQLAQLCPESCREQGCLSAQDLVTLGFGDVTWMQTNGQNRNGCLCLTCKTELLENRHRCPHQCAYCYWKD